jgi:hypothetical protein
MYQKGEHMSQSELDELAGRLAWDILNNETYLPVDRNGKGNRENIHDAIIIAMYRGDLGPLTTPVVNTACDIVDEVLYQLRTRTKD